MAENKKVITTEVIGQLVASGKVLSEEYANQLYCTVASIEEALNQIKAILAGSTQVLIEERENPTDAEN